MENLKELGDLVVVDELSVKMDKLDATRVKIEVVPNRINFGPMKESEGAKEYNIVFMPLKFIIFSIATSYWRDGRGTRKNKRNQESLRRKS